MKIVSVSRFIKSIIVLGIFIILSVIISNSSFSYIEPKYKEVNITRGETLWSIAQNEQKNNNYYEGKDIRVIIQSIKKINNLEDSNVYEGQRLLIAEI